MNCKNVIVSGLNVTPNLLASYAKAINQSFESLNKQNGHLLKIVEADAFQKQVLADKKNVGIYIAAIGVQQSHALNQTKGIRAAVVHNKYLAQMCRKHNDANVIVIASDYITDKLTGLLAKDYLTSSFDNTEKEILRVGKFTELEEKYSCKC